MWLSVMAYGCVCWRYIPITIRLIIRPKTPRKKIACHIIEFGIRGPYPDAPEILDIKAWQDEIASKPFK
jgi:hypothetical protein